MTQTRKTQSKSKIRDAYLTLLQEQPFEKISVATICREAGINRGTFYLHYLDKFDLTEKLIDEVKDHLNQLLQDNHYQMEEALFQALLYIQSEKKQVYTLANSAAANITEEIEHFIRSLIHKNKTFQTELTKRLAIDQDYLLTSFTGSITAMLMHWLNNDCQESPQEIAKMLTQIRLTYAGQD